MRDSLGGCMSRSRRASYIAFIALVAACRTPPPVAATPQCISSWLPTWTADKSVALCIPSDFVSAYPDAWGRPQPNRGFSDFLSVKLLSWPQDSAFVSWPPHLASPADCFADCAIADSVVVHRDTIAGIEVSTEVGLISGGEPGFRKHPFLRVGWIVSTRSRAFAQGWATHPATLDTLRAMLRTVRIADRKR
jgi:hypothetical protein